LVGLYGKPTLINNVETLTNVPMILANGADWYKTMGTGDSAGVKIFSLSGRVRKPGNYELPFGTTFRQLIYEHGGGILDGRSVKVIMPAGASSSMIVVDDKVLDTPMDYASVRTLGSELGSASVIVIDDTVSVDWIVNKTIHFFKTSPAANARPAAKARIGCRTSRIASTLARERKAMWICYSMWRSRCKASACARSVNFPRWLW
jgi:NADH-quinone oxidoreductase subunit F